MKARILVRARGGAAVSYPVGATPMLIGRDRSAALSLPMEGVSRLHAQLSCDGKAYWLDDLKSTNGTFVNGQAVERERLRHLDVIGLGKKVELIFVLRAEDAPSTRRTGIVRAALVREGRDPVEITAGEVSLGRSPVCNVVLDELAVSKLHARIERTPDRLVLRDLASANGSFVNGVRVETAALANGDAVSLAGTEPFRVVVELGEVLVPRSEPPAPLAAAPERATFSAEWRTRFEWSTDELAQLAEARRRGGAAAPAPAPVFGPPGSASAPRAAPGADPDALPGSPTLQLEKLESSPFAAGARRPESETKTLAPLPVASPPATRVAAFRVTGEGIDRLLERPGAYAIGRGSDVELRVVHPTVSRRHAAVTLLDDRSALVLEDLGGANGTLVNGAEIAGARTLRSGDVIRVGDVELRVTLTSS